MALKGIVIDPGHGGKDSGAVGNGIKEKDYCDVVPSNSNMMTSLTKTFKNKDFRIFVGQDIIYFFGLAMFQTGLPFFVTSLLQLPESMTTVMFGGLTLLSLAFYPFVIKISSSYHKGTYSFVRGAACQGCSSYFSLKVFL